MNRQSTMYVKRSSVMLLMMFKKTKNAPFVKLLRKQKYVTSLAKISALIVKSKCTEKVYWNLCCLLGGDLLPGSLS